MKLCVTVEGSPRVDALPSSLSSTWPEMSNKSNPVSLLPHLVYVLCWSVCVDLYLISAVTSYSPCLLYRLSRGILFSSMHNTAQTARSPWSCMHLLDVRRYQI